MDSLRRIRSMALGLIVMLGIGAGWGETILIDTGGDPNSRLELRNVVLPGGEEVQLYVVQGEEVRITIGDRELIAEHIEVDLTSRLVRIIGSGTFVTPEQTVRGSNLVIELEQESLVGQDVLIITDSIDVEGAEANRVPGQIDVLNASFSPCSRCAQEVEDYGFRAERLELYPGDRLVAFGATVLIRGVDVINVPVLVVPLARPDRQPRLAIERGTATERAEIALDWPYVAGANAFGTFSVRYYADVTPIPGGGLQVLGGRVDESYLGGGVNHVFYTERGEGAIEVFYRPGFVGRDGGEPEDPLYTVRFAYATLDELTVPGVPSLELEVVRDDERRQGLLEYRIESSGTRSGVRGSYMSQGFVDLDPGDTIETPSYDDRQTPRRTPVRLVIEPEQESFSIGPVLLRRLVLDLGTFEDASNPSNRSAAAERFAQAGRLLERHALELPAQQLWSGLELSGHTNFAGYYYTTGERQIDWDTRIALDQRIASIGTFGVVFNRDVNEGETPFRFDQIALRTRTDLRASLQLRPLPWLSLEGQGGYVFRDSRRPELEGFQPVETRLRLFDNLNWLSASVSNSYDVEQGDPGNLQFELEVRNPASSPRASLQVRHREDLAVRPDRLTGAATDESETTLSLSYATSALRVEASGGYRYHPIMPEDPTQPLEYWLPFVAGVTVGTLEQEDALPGLRVVYERDLNRGRLDALALDMSLRLGPVELAAQQRFDLPQGGMASSTATLTYPGWVELEATGFTLVQPSWLGLPEGEPRTTRYTVTLRDAPERGREAWQLRYLTRYDPNLTTPTATGGFRDSTLEARVLLEEEQWGGTRFSVDFFADLQLSDDRLERTYLRRASLELGVDIEGVVGVQGALGYTGALNTATGEHTRAELRLDEVAITVRALDELYVGALFDDVWDFTGSNPERPAFDLRPELFAVWDRCCWALLAAWNTESGAIRVSLTTPGGDRGVTQVVDTPLALPGRGFGGLQ